MLNEKEVLLTKLINDVYDIEMVDDKVVLGVKAENVECLIEHLVNEMDLKLVPTMEEYTEEEYSILAKSAQLLGRNPIQEHITVDLDFEYIESDDTTTILLGFDALFSKKTLNHYGLEGLGVMELEEDFLYTHPFCDFYEVIAELLEEIEGLNFDSYADDSGVTSFLNYSFKTKGINICDVFVAPTNEFDDYLDLSEEYITIMNIEIPKSVYQKYTS